MRKPRFVFSQDESSVTLSLSGLHHLRQQDLEFFVGDHEFRFLCAPFALKLAFDGALVPDDGAETASYCLETGVLRVTLTKRDQGQVFAEPRLLVDPDEELFASDDDDGEGKGDDDRPPVYYGFNNHYTGVFRGLEDYDILELGDPEGVPPEQRRLLRQVAEET